ncbi:MAG: hypothetical protein IT430_09810 [Phycisphaerales bacterium]|nr:hypothetical protein [Phycisphaerales bacterium]
MTEAPIVITLPKARSPLLPYQQRWMADESDLKIWEKSRRIGATYVEACDVAFSRLSGRRNEDYWFSSADESAAFEFIEYVKFWCKVAGRVLESFTEQVDDGTRNGATAYCVRFPSGKRCTAMSSNPRRFRSKGGDVGLDEFAFHEQASEMYKAASPCTTWGGRLRILSSHNGEQSKFNEFVQMAQRHAAGSPKAGDVKFSLHRTTIEDAVADGLVEKINEVKGTTYTRESFLADCRAKCATQDDWLQEYMCVPSAETEAYLPYDLLNTCLARHGLCAAPTDDLAKYADDLRAYTSGASAIYAGNDIGRTNDRFVLWTIARFGGTWSTAGLLRWQNRKFSAMEEAIAATMNFRSADDKRVRRICIDRTGLGMQLAEQACEKFRTRAEGVHFGNETKAEMAPRVLVAFQEGTIKIPDDRLLKDDLHSLRKSMTSSGNVRYAGERGANGHADHFWALALALEAADKPVAQGRAVTVTGGSI